MSDPSHSLIQSGRTTRMLEHAKQLNAQGKAVYVVVANQRQADHFTALHRDTPSIKFETPQSLGNFDWQTLTLTSAWPNVVVLVDHYAIESRFGPLLKMLHAYDPATPTTSRETFIANLKATMALFPDVEWDRYAGDEKSASLFGWVPRTDGRRDFLLIKFIDGEVSSYSTSSAKHSGEFADRLDCEHSTCQRVADLFDHPETIL